MLLVRTLHEAPDAETDVLLRRKWWHLVMVIEAKGWQRRSDGDEDCHHYCMLSIVAGDACSYQIRLQVKKPAAAAAAAADRDATVGVLFLWWCDN